MRPYRTLWLGALCGLSLIGVIEASELRLVSLSPHLTELLFAAGAGAQLVGVAEYSDHPAAAREIPRIGGHSGLDYERILALKPDLVFAWPSGNGHQSIQRLRDLGLRVEVSDPRSLDDIADDLERLGQLTGHLQQARRAADALRQRLLHLGRHYRRETPVRLFYQIWDRPLMTVSGQHILNQAMALCGGENLFADLDLLTPQVSREAVVLARPELILLPTEKSSAQAWQAVWQQLPDTGDWRFVMLDPDLLQRPTPRMLDGIEQLCRAINQAKPEEPLHER